MSIVRSWENHFNRRSLSKDYNSTWLVPFGCFPRLPEHGHTCRLCSALEGKDDDPSCPLGQEERKE